MSSPIRVLLADGLDPDSLGPLTEANVQFEMNGALTADDLPGAIAGFDGLVVRSTKVTAATIESGSDLQFVVRAGAGVDNIDTDAASKAGVFVCNVPGRNAVAVAELTMGLLLAIDRRIADNTADLRAGTWNKAAFSRADGLMGKTIAIIGLGDIGLAVARRAKAFGLTVTAVRKDGRSPEVQQRIRAIGIRMVEDQSTLLAEADIVTLHVPKSPTTAGMVDEDFLAQLKSGAILLNTSRGEVVNEAALIKALDGGLRAGLDVYADEPKSGTGQFVSDLAAHANVVGTHHIGASTDQAQRSVGEGTVETILAYVSGSPINVVNMRTEPTGEGTLIVKHLDRVGVLASIFELLRSAGVNVEQMENRLFSGPQGAAVATIHVNKAPAAGLVSELCGLQNVLAVTTAGDQPSQ